MDLSDYTRVVFNKIQKLEPENVSKIVGYLLLQDHAHQEIINLALGPDQLVPEVIYRVKLELQQLAAKSSSPPISSHVNLAYSPLANVSSRAFSSPAVFHRSPSYLDPQLSHKHCSEFGHLGYADSLIEAESQTQSFGFEDQMEAVYSGIPVFSNEGYNADSPIVKPYRRLSGMPEFHVKACHYFNKGFCKHGSSCRYFHGQVTPESFPLVHRNDATNKDVEISPGSLEKLEIEIIEILKSRRGNPVSIASLPMIYYERYRKVLQAEGYLTESQRHGKAGYSLTKLLARLKSSIKVIDRPHGQHAVVLAEDAHRYAENRNEKSDPGPIVSGSRQIYLTFPAESTFTEDDVSMYFNTFGPVEDVRIPCQHKRMFGFVTFVSSDTVKIILAKGNPHFVCGARVLVKPYREKPKLVDRKYQERTDLSMYHPSLHAEPDANLYQVPRGHETSRLWRRQLIDEQEALELETRHLAELSLIRKSMSNQPYSGYSADAQEVPEGNFSSFPEQFDYLFDVPKCGSASDDKPGKIDTNYADMESCPGLDLPESPFAPSVASGISTVM